MLNIKTLLMEQKMNKRKKEFMTYIKEILRLLFNRAKRNIVKKEFMSYIEKLNNEMLVERNNYNKKNKN